jgi:hypothetical protein
MANEIENVFFSRLHEDDAGLDDLKELAGKGGVTVRDSSIHASNPNEAPKIRTPLSSFRIDC